MVPLYWSHYNMFYFCFSLFCHFFSCTVLCFLLLLFCLCRRICPSVFFLSCLLSCYRKNIFSMYFCCSRCSIQKTKLGHVGGDVEEKIKLHIYSHLDSGVAVKVCSISQDSRWLFSIHFCTPFFLVFLKFFL